MELGVKDDYSHLMPANILCDGNLLYIKVNTAFVNDKIKAFKALREQGVILDKVTIERNFEPCQYLEQQSVTLKNFEVNTKYNKVYSSDFHSFSFVEPGFRELLEYHTVGEFNRIRGKEFLSFSAFHQVYTEANMKLPFVPNYT